MKINKILAAGIAATLAVTSLSTVVGAEKQSKSYNLYTTKANGSKTLTIQAEVNKDIAQHLQQNKMQAIVLSDIATPFTGSYVDGIEVVVTGYQTKGATASQTKTFKFKKDDKSTGVTKDKWRIVVLDKKTPVYHDGEFASFYFDTITSLTLNVTVKGTTLDADTFNNNWSSEKFLTIGGIDIYDVVEQTAACGDHDEWVFGEKHTGLVSPAEEKAGDIAVNDKAEVVRRAAAEVVDPVAAAESATEAAKFVGKGLLIGTKVVTPEKGAINPGSEIIATQALYKGTAAKANVYTAPEATALGVAPDAPAAETEVTDEAPIIINGELKTSGYVYVVKAADDKGTIIYNPTGKLTDDEKKSIKELTADKTISAITAINSKLEVVIQGAAAANAIASETTVPVIKEVDKSEFDHIVADAPSSTNAVIAANEGKVNAVIRSSDGQTLKTSKVEVFGQAFTTYQYDPKANSVAPLLAYAFANGGWYTTAAQYGDGKADAQKFKFDTTTEKLNAWLPVTVTDTSVDPYKGMVTITRRDVKYLSKTDEYNSLGGSTLGNETAYTQTYEDVMTAGTRPTGFSGLASQVANFFNKQNNGTITFTFTSSAAGTGATLWSEGIPSTEVGLIGSGAGSVTANFALFFNYGTTGGMMLSKAKADVTKGTVEFDISDYLAQSGTLTMATLHDIYYGLNVGIKDSANKYGGGYGLEVSKVELAYDDAPAADADAAAAEDDDATVADDDDAAAVVDADDDDDDDDTALIEDDDDDDDDDATIIADDDDDDTDDDDIAAVITDDDEDDTAAAGTVDVVTPAAQDSNPATGVGLAVIPAIVAAAAMAISKKRK